MPTLIGIGATAVVGRLDDAASRPALPPISPPASRSLPARCIENRGEAGVVGQFADAVSRSMHSTPPKTAGLGAGLPQSAGSKGTGPGRHATSHQSPCSHHSIGCADDDRRVRCRLVAIDRRGAKGRHPADTLEAAELGSECDRGPDNHRVRGRLAAIGEERDLVDTLQATEFGSEHGCLPHSGSGRQRSSAGSLI